MAIIRRDCPHCPTKQVAFQIAWVVSAGDTYRWFGAAVCGACSHPIVFDVRSTIGSGNPPSQFEGNIESYFAVLNVWPGRAEIAAPRHTPDPVARRYLEGEEAFARHSWNAAVAMYRSALDIATKSMEGVPKGQTFFKRLAWLHENNRITPDMREWADHVRVEGNEALHDPEDFKKEDAEPLRLFTEMFLRYVFELPGEVREFRGEPHPSEGIA